MKPPEGPLAEGRPAPWRARASRLEIAFWLGLLACIVAIAPFVWFDLVLMDEFSQLSHAQRILAGDVLYRDFSEFIAPLNIWLLAAVFAVFGTSLVAARVCLAVLLVAASAQLWWLGRRLGVGPWVAWLPGWALLHSHYAHYPGVSHHWLALVGVLAAMQTAFLALDRDDSRWWAAAGVLAGLTGLAVQSDGIVLASALFGFIAIHGWLAGAPLARTARSLGAGLAGLAAPLALAASICALQGALGDAFYSMFIWPTQHYRTPGGINDIPFLSDFPLIISPVRELPGWYGRLAHYALLYLVAGAATGLALAWGLGRLARRLRSGPGLTPADARLGLAGIVAIAFILVSARGRADFVHISMYASPAFLFAAALIPRWAARFPAWHDAPLRALPACMLALYAATGTLMAIKGVAKNPDAWLSWRTPDERLRDTPVIRWLREHARPGDRLVALPVGGFYYFYALPPATRTGILFTPDLGYTPPAEWRAMGTELAVNRPRFVLIAPWAYGDQAALRAQYASLLPPGYEKVAEVATPQWAGIWPAVIYEDHRSPR